MSHESSERKPRGGAPPDRKSHRLLLLAQLSNGTTRIVTHTAEISESMVFVPTDEDAYIGDKVLVNFSFPGLVRPFSLETQVIARRVASPDRLPGWILGFVFYREAEQTMLRNLLGQLHRASDAANTNYRVLLVEDNVLTREAFIVCVNRFFGHEHSGVSVDIVEDGQAAWERLQGEPYDLAIVDYFLPQLNGDSLIARLRREPALARLPIFAVSGGGTEAREATMAAGADLFLPKPLVLRDLFGTLKQLVSTPSGKEALAS